jgi:hypothetical protein
MQPQQGLFFFILTLLFPKHCTMSTPGTPGTTTSFVSAVSDSTTTWRLHFCYNNKFVFWNSPGPAGAVQRCPETAFAKGLVVVQAAGVGQVGPPRLQQYGFMISRPFGQPTVITPVSEHEVFLSGQRLVLWAASACAAVGNLTEHVLLPQIVPVRCLLTGVVSHVEIQFNHSTGFFAYLRANTISVAAAAVGGE